jgi:adenylate cyclase
LAELNPAIRADAAPHAPVPPPPDARAFRMYIVWAYVLGSLAATAVVFLLVFLGLGFTAKQWWDILLLACIVVPGYIIPDLYLIWRHVKPITDVLPTLRDPATVDKSAVSRAIVCTLNMPFYSFLRVTLFHGPMATILVGIGMYAMNDTLQSGWELWQIVFFMLTIFFFASPAHAICEFFVIAKKLTPDIEYLWRFCDRIEPEHQKQLITIRLGSKLLYLSIFVTTLPLLYLAGSILYKAERILEGIGLQVTFDLFAPLLLWTVGVATVCIGGVLVMSILTAMEVSRSAARLVQAMRAVEKGELDTDIHATTTDEYADLFRGFNLMLGSLREEVQILQISHNLAGELNLDVLLGGIMSATSTLLDADRSTLFLYDSRRNELFSRIAEGIDIKEIRIPADQGIAGNVFQTKKTANITDPYSDPRFNKEVDRRTGYRTESILAMPILNKAGECIGVTQVLNKRNGKFISRDATRLGAFTAQIAVALENARLFEDVLKEKNYNDSILRSTSDGIITLDADDRILTANDAALRVLELDRDRVVSRPARELFRGRDEWVLQSLDKVKQGGQREIAIDMELQFERRSPASVNLGLNPLLDVNEEHIGSMIVLEDITSEKRVKSTMARYMSPQVVQQLLAEGESVLGGKAQNVSILFSDIRGFTTVSEALGPRETVAMLNEYFERMVDVLMANGGVLDKFIGDAIMALFGVPFNGERDADNALDVANGMIVALDALNQARIARGNDRIDIGIGISTGPVIVGNIGSPKRMEYTVIGDSVNLGSRLEGVTKTYGCRILISDGTRQALKGDYRLREIDLLRVKGKTEPIAIHEAMGHYSTDVFRDVDQAIAVFTEAMRCYRTRQWTAAIEGFRQVLAMHPGDRPSRVFVERAEYFQANDPGTGWDGVWTMTSK